MNKLWSVPDDRFQGITHVLRYNNSYLKGNQGVHAEQLQTKLGIASRFLNVVMQSAHECVAWHSLK